jgi:hypothetical protein
MLEGGCFCGKVRYQITGEIPHIVSCHCSMCRRANGAPFVTWLVVPKANFSYQQGEPKLLKSSEAGSRFFCAECGTHIACSNTTHEEIVDVTLGSLDDPSVVVPSSEIFADSKLAWLT